MAEWFEKISKEELAFFLEKFGKLVSDQVAEEKPFSPENLETTMVSKFYFEGELFEVVRHFLWQYHQSAGGSGHSGEKKAVISITTL